MILTRKFEPKLSWHSFDDDLINEFYRPALENATLYQRKAGFFSSTSFLDIAGEIISIIKKRGRIELITSPKLSSSDIDIIQKSVIDKEKLIEEMCLKKFFEDDEDELKKDFRKIMAYMLVTKINDKPLLEIKIALTEDGIGMYHEKLGIIYKQDDDIISFTGSINETSFAWKRNGENFKAFCNWRGGTDKLVVDDDIRSFKELWEGKRNKVRIYELPKAVSEKILEIIPKSESEFEEIIQSLANRLGIKSDELIEKIEKKEIRDFQKEAIEKWVKNDFRGILSMATGTGKTFTAFGCINKFQRSNQQSITIIACPQTHLVEQWKTQFQEYNKTITENFQITFEKEVTCDSDYPNWDYELNEILMNYKNKLFNGKTLINNFTIYVTHKTLNMPRFKEYIRSINTGKILLIVDEVHNIGSELSQAALLEEYHYRLGLSATPERHYDEDGTYVLKNYFNGVVYEYPLEKAIVEGYLCNYDYFPMYAELNNEEMEIYDELTKKIAAKYSKKQRDSTDDNNNAEIRRASLIANADNKLQVLEKILKLIPNIKQTLIYCTSDPSPALPFGSKTQLQKVEEILVKERIVSTSVTYENPTKDRTMILDKLAIGHYDCVTAVRCLDEGMDIPSAEIAIILASSGNPKQYIQRRGRVLRTSEKTGKTKAVIYDILVKTPLSNDDSEITKRERKLVAKELLRHKEFAKIALNRDQAFASVREVAKKYRLDLDLLDEQYIQNLD